MSGARTRRRRAVVWVVAAWAVAALAVAGCATGTTEEMFDASGGGGFDAGAPMDRTIPKPDIFSPPFEGGVDDADGVDSDGLDARDDHTKKKHDGGPEDAGVDTACVGKTVAVSDAGSLKACPSGSACGDTVSASSFTPTWIPPNPTASSCTAGQVTTIYNDCLGSSASTSKCNSAKSSDKACYDCIFTEDTAASLGAVIVLSNGGGYVLNQGGCIDLLEPCNLECAEANLAATYCELKACEKNCGTIKTLAEDDKFLGCLTKAGGCDPNGCGAYGNEATNCGKLLTGAGHPASVCIAPSSSTTFQELFDAIVPVFCE